MRRDENGVRGNGGGGNENGGCDEEDRLYYVQCHLTNYLMVVARDTVDESACGNKIRYKCAGECVRNNVLHYGAVRFSYHHQSHAPVVALQRDRCNL